MAGTCAAAAAPSRSSRLSRVLHRSLTFTCAALLTGSVLGAPLAAHAQDDALAQSTGEPMELAAISYLGNAELPPAVGQASFAVYLPETGHTLSDVFLDYWRATGEEAMFGFPISEPFATEEGTYAQVFERGVLEYLPVKVWTVEPFVRPMPVGRLLIGERNSGLGAPGAGKRLASGNRAQAMRFLAADDPVVQAVLANGGYYDSTSGHTISGAFLDWYWAHEGDYYLGAPLSEIVQVDGHAAQWFDGGLLIETADGVQLAPLGEQLAQRFGVSTAPLPEGDLPAYAETLFQSAPNPAPLAQTDGHGPKRIEVSIDQQMLWAYEGNTLVLETPVSTGLTPNDTERGRWRVRYKVPSEDMRGATDPEGNVVWVVGDGGDAPAGSIPYGVSDVPNVMYVNLDAEALHGAYWHN
ncbi:MAG: L,D-transpeptidase family protein, partial [Thermomicrobiales bacterium]|nr:L,D-transpeptidase family protein [Thermomicrobiales bacterium]